MTLSELYMVLKSDHMIIMKKSQDRITVRDCYRVYDFAYAGKVYSVRFNLLTLDFKTLGRMPVALRSKIKSRIIREEYLKWKFKKEGRAFFDFINLYYDRREHLVFTDCESPDFIIHDHLDHGYEVTEATDAHNAKFNEAVYLVTGMDKQSRELKVYIEQIQRSLTNKRHNALSIKSRQYEDGDYIHRRIFECVMKKVQKYKEYNSVLHTRNIIVFNNRIGFRRHNDFKQLSDLMQSNIELRQSNIDRIYIIGGTHDILVEFNKYGQLLKVKKR